ncbi:MAG: ferredoxin oxidoreductase [Patescibacteria group bacterium]|nr:ferredoxin oxidoreductase [Patescibacteria group bacterium]
MKKEFLMGSETIVKGAIAAGAQMMTGYPITPTTEIMEHWAEEAAKNPALKFLQTEDEMSAGFAMIGAILAGVKAFTASAGPGNVLMQDAFSMAENMRLPTVAFIGQRGGPSTGTVIYSQQELNLTCFGGNGEGLRIVYSTAGGQELYDYAIKAFNTAWKYRFPTFVLTDGYQNKTQSSVEIYQPQEKQVEIVSPTPYLLNPQKQEGTFTHIRNTYNLEQELADVLIDYKKHFTEITPEILEFEDYHTLDAEIVIFAHGIVAAAAKLAVDSLRNEGKKVGLFRPITLNPFPKESAINAVTNKKGILITESSLGQFERMVKSNIYPANTPIFTLKKPAVGIMPEEIIEKINQIFSEKGNNA